MAVSAEYAEWVLKCCGDRQGEWSYREGIFGEMGVGCVWVLGWNGVSGGMISFENVGGSGVELWEYQ